MDGDEKITGPHSTVPYTGTKEYPADRTLHFTDHLTFSGAPEPSKPNNATNTNTVLVNPQEVVSARPAFARFAGQSVWHCHMLEHEYQEPTLPHDVIEYGPG